MSSRADAAFTTIGFSNWKNAQLQREHDKKQGQRRKSLLHQITCICYLLRQGLAIRNDHAGGPNLVVMLEQVLNERLWVKEGKYQSPEIVNEIIGIMDRKVLRSLISDIQCQKFSL